jgi:hypothetical protein
MQNNPGFDPIEIKKLKEECECDGQNFVLVEDDQELSETGEYVQFQFVGKYDGKEVIYDAAMFTLELHYQSVVMEEAERRVKKLHPSFIPIDERSPGYKVDEKMDELVEDFIEEIEEEEEVKVSEFVEIDENFEFGIGLEIGLNVTEIDVEVISRFVENFNAGTLSLDKGLYTFKSEED